MHATTEALARVEANFAAPQEIHEVVTVTAPCPSGHPDAAWLSENIGNAQGRTRVVCVRCDA